MALFEKFTIFKVTLLILGLCLGHSVSYVCVYVSQTKCYAQTIYYFPCVPALIQSNESAH